MLGLIFYFLNNTTNTLQLPYDMISPTAGLQPIGKIIHFDLALDYVKEYNFDDSEPAYYAFIWHNIGASSTPVFDDEDVAFLSY